VDLRVLFVEDREDDVLLVLREMQSAGFRVQHKRVETEEDMRQALRDQEWDAIISDFAMPRFSGPAALAVLQESRLDLPFIMVSGTVGEETAVAALKGGAHDFLSKHNLKRFTPALERELREARSRRDRRRAEERLRESEALLDAVFRASLLPIVTVDLDELVTSWNPAAERVLGWSAEEMIGRKPPFPIADKDELVRERKDGTPIRMTVSASQLEDRSGNVSGTVAIITDITKQRALEEQFRQAQKMEAVGLLAGGIAHDFNNILTAIQGYATLTLSDLPKDSEHYQDVQEILDAALRAASFTRQLLAFSRKQVTQPEVLDANELLSHMRNMLGRVIGESYVLRFELGENVGTIFSDRGNIEQVVMNLVVNARDAMPEGGTITIRTERSMTLPQNAFHGDDGAANGPYTVLRVGDSGHGMKPEVMARIFEPFYTTKESGKGTGLGLSTVYGIVVQNRGSVTVESQIGRGTEFSIYLPEAAPATRRAEMAAAPMDPSVARLAPCCLLVEDDVIVRRLLQKTMARAGFNVLTARDAAEALEILNRQIRVDVLVTDMMLPGMNGAELIEQAKVLVPGIKTVLVSGYSSEDLELPADYAFLEKPFTPDALITTLREFYGRGAWDQALKV
jgi:two-component system, cell cycle sensor histidine kinase and response regulator CckA